MIMLFWSKRKGEFRRKIGDYTLIVDMDSFEGKHQWRAMKGIYQYGNGSAPTIHLAQKEALYWYWQHECTYYIIQNLVDDRVLDQSYKAHDDLVNWAKGIKDNPLSLGLLGWTNLYTEHLKGAKASCQ